MLFSQNDEKVPECGIQYIPERLHRNSRPLIEEFEVGECLYMRCKPEFADNPYKNISIAELSHNRAGLSIDILCNPDDVLYSIKHDEPFEKYEDKEVCTLEIKSLTPNNRYKKTFTQEKNGEVYTGEIELLHDPELCMYPHSIFRVWLNGEKITMDNFSKTIGKLNVIKTQLKEELASMVRRRQVHQEETPLEKT
ncbi:hypothetical protein SAMN05518672_1011380 [Chitinophaga sp. CF118]|nr:hypothetical protein SAMN05518672_1011380 [Chitinophaga sp. CF118]